MTTQGQEGNGQPSEVSDVCSSEPPETMEPIPSGTRPAAETSHIGSSGTSGTISETTTPTHPPTPPAGHTISTISTFGGESLPDVPDVQETPSGSLPDGAGRGGNSDTLGMIGGVPSPCDAVPLSSDAQSGIIISGVVRVGGMRSRRENHTRHESADLCQLLRQDFPPDTVIEAEDGAQFSVVDADTHHWPDIPTAGELAAYMAEVQPTPDAAWFSHGHGIKLLYVGRSHDDRALAAGFSLPTSFHVELLHHTRHPLSISTDHGGAMCGPVEFFENDRDAEYIFRAVGPPTAEQYEEALQQLGLQEDGRYDHDQCPIDPEAASDARGCVTVLNAGIFCHRCSGRGVSYANHLRPGYLPFSAVVGNETSLLDNLAGAPVHWTHAHLVLHHHFPNLSDSLLEQAYRRTLESRYGADDPRIWFVFNPDLDFVWGDGLWLDATMLQPTQVDNDAAGGLPYVRRVVEKDGKKWTVLNLPRRSQVKNRTPRGYLPIRPVRGMAFADDSGAIPVIAPPAPRYPIQLLDDPLPSEEAFRRLEEPFPRFSPQYLQACIAAAICAEARRGQPPMIACTGPSGSGKEQHIRLAASFLGEDITKLAITEDDEKFFRGIGAAASSGQRFLAFDEFGKVRKNEGKLRMLLQISGNVSWRPLYRNSLVKTEVRSAFFFPCVRFPESLTTSQEFCRRTRRMHLHRRVPDWAETSGGDTCEWRDRSAENAYIANSILTHVWRICHEFEFRFT